jgi:predicted nuclease of predicted toxin-antitoxin system
MIIVADEGIDKQIVDKLRGMTFSVIYIAEMSPGITDDEVLSIANDNEALLITADKDFGELVIRLQKTNKGVVLFRLAGLPSSSKADIAADVFRNYADKLPHSFTVVTPAGIRIRPVSIP